jgi:Bifunctional DNA primase/polymerase, N-terminal/Primase C terminal 1 (PriCT-1)
MGHIAPGLPAQDRLTAATAIRLQLARAGFSPIPISGKRPVLERWQDKHQTTADEVALWAQLYPAAINTGILTRWAPTLDIDVLDDEAASAVEALVRERFDERGRILVRFGRPPKRAVVFRTDKPFKKILVKLTAPDGRADQQLELLGDGQQLVARGIHVDTGKPYGWHGGRPGGVKRSELPCITEAEAQALVTDAMALLVAKYGYHAKMKLKLPRPGRQPRTDWRTVNLEAVSEGARNDTLCRVLGHLLRCDVDIDVTRQLSHAWNRQCFQPPLADEEVDCTMASVVRKERERRRGQL